MSQPTLRDRSRAARRGEREGGPDVPALGAVFAGRYRLIEPIGALVGGRRLFRARDDILARDVAVAVYRVDERQPPRLTGARALAALDHPSLITLYDAQLTGDGNAYVVMSPSSPKRCARPAPSVRGTAPRTPSPSPYAHCRRSICCAGRHRGDARRSGRG